MFHVAVPTDAPASFRGSRAAFHFKRGEGSQLVGRQGFRHRLRLQVASRVGSLRRHCQLERAARRRLPPPIARSMAAATRPALRSLVEWRQPSLPAHWNAGSQPWKRAATGASCAGPRRLLLWPLAPARLRRSCWRLAAWIDWRRRDDLSPGPMFATAFRRLQELRNSLLDSARSPELRRCCRLAGAELMAVSVASGLNLSDERSHSTSAVAPRTTIAVSGSAHFHQCFGGFGLGWRTAQPWGCSARGAAATAGRRLRGGAAATRAGSSSSARALLARNTTSRQSAAGCEMQGHLLLLRFGKRLLNKGVQQLGRKMRVRRLLRQ